METPSDYNTEPLYFTHINYNEETHCLEAYLDGESDPRTDIPAEPAVIQSLIALLQDYYQNHYKKG
jgi:hypothetical protein